MIINFDEIRDLIENGNLSEVSRETGMSWRTLQSYKLTENNWLANTEKKLAKLQNYINKQKNNENTKGAIIMENKLMGMDWEEFVGLDEVQIEGPATYGGEASMFYNDGDVQVSVVIDADKNHDDTTVWEDQELFEELLEKAIEAIDEYIDSLDDKERVEYYLENFEHTTSSDIDSVFGIAKSDVSSIAQDYKRRSAYIYDRDEWIEHLQEMIDEADEEAKEMFQEELEEFEGDNDTVVVSIGDNNYYL